MRIKTLAIASLALLAVPAAAQTASSPEDYVMQAGSGDLYEKTASQMIAKSTNDPKVRQFANMMISDHGKSTAKVRAAAIKDGMKPKAARLMPEQEQMLAELRTASGRDRDKMYVSQQKTAHVNALALHEGYAASGTSAPLKAAAGEIVPVVKMHAEMLNAM